MLLAFIFFRSAGHGASDTEPHKNPLGRPGAAYGILFYSAVMCSLPWTRESPMTARQELNDVGAAYAIVASYLLAMTVYYIAVARAAQTITPAEISIWMDLYALRGEFAHVSHV